jgi:hypothetical protein
VCSCRRHTVDDCQFIISLSCINFRIVKINFKEGNGFLLLSLSWPYCRCYEHWFITVKTNPPPSVPIHYLILACTVQNKIKSIQYLFFCICCRKNMDVGSALSPNRMNVQKRTTSSSRDKWKVQWFTYVSCRDSKWYLQVVQKFSSLCLFWPLGPGSKCGRYRLILIKKSFIFWDITPCSPLKVNRRFGGICRLNFRVDE